MRSDQIADAAIARAVADDSDAAPLVDSDWFAAAVVEEPSPKKLISLRIDPDILDYFKQGGAGYQTRINAVLRAYVAHHRDGR